MEMIMRVSSTLERREQAGSGVLATLVATLKRLCVAYITWRMERSAIVMLRSMSDRELSLIGLSRSDIPGAAQAHAPGCAGAACSLHANVHSY
jgi:uncharacterized protein YjiS (DUF1127 family)